MPKVKTVQEKRVVTSITLYPAMHDLLKRESYHRDISIGELLDEIIACYFDSRPLKDMPPHLPNIGELYGKRCK